MTVTDLIGLLRANRVPEWFYVTDGGLGAGECVGLEQTGAGWSVYYSERGRKTPIADFASEDAACRLVIATINRMLRQSGRPPLP